MRGVVTKMGFAWAVAAVFSTVAVGGARAAEEKVLNVYNWSDYIAEDTIEKFEKETGIKVNYDVYDSNEVVEAKLLTGKSGYDIVVPTAMPFVARLIKAGALQKLDRSKLSNYGNLDAEILKRAEASDPGNQYGVPYMWGTTGLGYNVEKVKKALGENAPVDSLRMIFDPAVAGKLAKCGIMVLDTADEILPAAMAYLGLDPSSQKKEDLEKAAAAVSKVRPHIKKFHSSQYIDALANGDICVAFGYSGDILQAAARAEEAKNGVEVKYAIPKEGARLWTDMMVVPKDAPHPEAAHAWINFIMRPEIAADISNYVAYANANAKATELVDEEVRNDPGVYPPSEVKARLFSSPLPSQEYERLRTRTWTKVKTGR